MKASLMRLIAEKEEGSLSPELKYHAHLRGESSCNDPVAWSPGSGELATIPFITLDRMTSLER